MVVQQHSEIHFPVSVHSYYNSWKNNVSLHGSKCKQTHGKEITLNSYIESYKPTALGPSLSNHICSVHYEIIPE